MSNADQGDRRLSALLEEAGVAATPAAVRELLKGVLAAPAGEDPDGWLVLLGVDPTTPLAEALRREKDALAAAAVPPVPDAAGRLGALRERLTRMGLHGFVVPRADEHQGEYVPPRAQRLAWLTGFTGSAGMTVVTAERAAMFVDGRYTIQVRAEVPETLFEYRSLIDDSLGDWIAGALPRGARFGYDPWLHTLGWVEKLRGQLDRAGIALVPCPDNPVDAVWPDQPPPPLAPVVPHPLRFAGRTAAEKRADIADRLKRNGIGAAVLTAPDSIAWLLNIRGGDVPCTPLPLAFAVLDDEARVDLFIDRRKLVPGLDEHLGDQVSVRSPESFAGALDELGRGGRRVLADPSGAAAWIFDRLHLAGALVVRDGDPCALPKACKNPTELDGARAAHRRDGAAVVRFLRWLSEESPTGQVTESAAAEALLASRRGGEHFRGPSFETISGAGPNGAIVHYRVSEATDRHLEPGTLYLVDSGAQYLDGTTDITRTVAVGTPTMEMRGRFTLVLKGHIALSTARFPKGTTGSQLDSLARHPLWQAGLDFDHGTGHGVGSFLSVHEGPQRIAKIPNPVPLQPGMILSNEPGYYKTDAFGIRIENLVVVQPVPDPVGAERPMMGFEVLTLAPIDRSLIDIAMLSHAEVEWIDSYHARVRDELTPFLDAATAAWLGSVTVPLGLP